MIIAAWMFGQDGRLQDLDDCLDHYRRMFPNEVMWLFTIVGATSLVLQTSWSYLLVVPFLQKSAVLLW